MLSSCLSSFIKISFGTENSQKFQWKFILIRGLDWRFYAIAFFSISRFSSICRLSVFCRFYHLDLGVYERSKVCQNQKELRGTGDTNAKDITIKFFQEKRSGDLSWKSVRHVGVLVIVDHSESWHFHW